MGQENTNKPVIADTQWSSAFPRERLDTPCNNLTNPKETQLFAGVPNPVMTKNMDRDRWANA